MDPQLLKRVIEAALLAAGQPLSLTQLGALFGETENITHEDLSRALEELAADCAERGIELKEVASGFRYQVREDVHGWVARLWTERQTKYSRASLETLALIAYRQPITRAEIEQIRGVAVSSSIIKTLEEREWVRVVGYRDVPGRPALFGTSRGFLDYFNLKSLDELPPLAEVRDLDEYDPQLALAPVATVEAAPAEGGSAEPVDEAANDDANATGVADDETTEASRPDPHHEMDTDAEADAGGDDEDEEEPPPHATDELASAAGDESEPHDDEERGEAADDGIVDRDPAPEDGAENPPEAHHDDSHDDAGDDAASDPTTSDDVPEHTA